MPWNSSQSIQRRQTCSMPVIGWSLALHSASIGRTTSRTKKLTLYPVFCRSVKLSEKEDFAWLATRCVFRIALPHLSFPCCKSLTSYSRGHGRTWNLAKDFLNDQNAIDCNINDITKFRSSLSTRLFDTFNSNFYCLRTFKHGISGMCLSWFRSKLSSRMKSIAITNHL